MSPARSFRLPGMPWMTCSLIETQREAGNWLYPRKAGSPPRRRSSSRAKSSSSSVLTPSCTSPASSWSVSARMALASRILEISAAFLSLIIYSALESLESLAFSLRMVFSWAENSCSASSP